MSDKIDFKVEPIRRDKEGHYILIKVKINHEDLTVLNIYASNSGAANFINTTLQDIKAQINPSTLTIRDFNTPTESFGQINWTKNKQRDI